MMRSLDIAATGLLGQQLNVDVISHNLANMTTGGFKRSRPEFQDLIYQNMRRVGTNSSDVGTVVPTGIQLGLGVKAAGINRSHEQGTITVTDNPLDVAVKGNGFFQVQMPDGEYTYTRNGSFQLSPQGEIVTVDGYIVSPGISIPENATGIAINGQGEVQVTLDGQIEPQTLGQLDMANFINPAGLEAMGDNLYKESAASGNVLLGLAGQEGFGSLQQGTLEQSNVDPVTEVTSLIVAQRAYEMNTKVISASDQMLQALNQAA
jgi:flagellar basal-body rod protein FlgG